MKKIVFLAFLYFTATDAFAACSSYTSSTNCNNDSSCYWKAGFGHTQTGQASGSCNDCTNTRKSFSGVLSSLYGVYNYTGSALNSDYTYCQTLYSCASNSASVKVTLASNWSGLTGAKLTDYLNVTCEICSSGMYRNNAGVVFLDYNEIGAVDLNGNVTSLPLSAGDVFQGCGTCGANAVVNSNQTNCNCKPHYAVYNTPSSIYGTTDIAERDCSPIIYTVYLNSTDTASTSSPYIKYKWGVGYELDGDNDYNDGTPVGSLLYTEKVKQTMDGWYLSPTGSTQIFRPGALYDTTNVVTMCENALGCDTSGYIVHLYAKYSWKNYTVKYNDGSNKTKTCTYNSDCKLDYAPTTAVQGGQLFKNWQYTLSGRIYTIAQDGNIKEIEQTGEFPDNVVLLTPVYRDCPAGYYCNNNVQTECQSGTYCLAGVSAETPCPAGYYCPDTKNDPKECGVGYYCPARRTAPTKCTAGYYCPTTTTVTPTECGMGNYCQEGSVSPNTCQAGYYCPTTTTVNPTKCDSGHYCPDAGMSAPKPCDSGYFCPEGSKSQNECPAGYYCPAQSEVAESCPFAGTTSGGNATSAADCYVSEKTNFKDKNDFIFNLPITAGDVKVK